MQYVVGLKFNQCKCMSFNTTASLHSIVQSRTQSLRFFEKDPRLWVRDWNVLASLF
jgi:hypothetical protein